ncbi:hypothetical protein KCU95_g11685, partial [Aureobasidium melanogenum]
MEDQNGGDYQHYLSRSRAAQISAHYNTTTSTSSAGLFKTPQLPQHTTSKSRAQPLAYASYLGDEHVVSSPLYEGYHHGGTPSLNYNNYVAHQQSLSPPFENADFVYGYQQVPRAHNSPHYTQHTMPSMNISSYYGMPHAAQPFPASTAPLHDLHSTTAGSGLYDAVSFDHQVFQISGFTDTSDGHDSYHSNGHAQQSAMGQKYAGSLHELFNQYQVHTREIFTLVRDRQLKPTASLLLQISNFLIGNVEALGLDRDDKNQYQDRLKLWDTFNQCWLTVLHSQHKTTQIMARTGQQLPLGQSTLDFDDLEVLGQEIVQLCDGIEKTGLVDYQMGVAEERIVDLLLKCLDAARQCSQATP